MRKLALTSALCLAFIALIAYGTQPGAAQTTTTPTPIPMTDAATPVPTVAGPANEVDAFFVACADAASVQFTGQMNANWDIYYQIFSGPDGTGTALTNLRQVQVDGSYTFNELIQYTGGGTVATGATASMRAFVARETDPSRVDFEFTINDIQDGCTNQQITPPSNAAAASVDAGAGSASAGTTSGAIAGVTANILAPGDGVLNPNLRPEPDVVVGARLSDNFRSDTPGLIFAECDAYPLALPGIVYDSDQITIFWSWYARTQEELQQHIDNANYVVTLNTATFPIVQRSEPVRRNGNWWTFYTANVGNLRPGHYEVGFALTWDQPISDGYDDFGPGTETPRMVGLCNFDITRNPENRSIVYTDMFQPTGGPVHNITPDD